MLDIGTLCLDFVPGYLFTGLSVFSWVCWIAPNNSKLPRRVASGVVLTILL